MCSDTWKSHDGSVTLIHGDCLDKMSLIADGSVDMVLADPPYGTTACKWDSVIPFDEMWLRLNKLIKPNGAIVLFGRNPFTANLIISNVKDFRYELLWKKSQATNFMFLKKQFGQATENISVFYKKQPIYNPQMVKSDKPIKSSGGNTSKTYNNQTFKGSKEIRYEKYPLNILEFKRDKGGLHPTQKPVALMEYLIKTYTNEGETVLDFTFGSGTTGEACIKTGRKFIGIELDESYFDVAVKRLDAASKQGRLF